MTERKRLTPEHLTQIRQHTDWRQLFSALQIEKDAKKSRDHDWWGKSPFQPNEETASFHINDRGWYCHSTSQCGGAIELVQKLHEGMSCYDAGRWLLERGISQITNGTRNGVEQVESGEVGGEKEPPRNPPIRQDLRP